LITMKKILFPTDFSANATHAAEYGYQLAKQIKANIILCNAVILPAEIPQAGLVTWPVEEDELLIADSDSELKRLKAHLQQHDRTSHFRPTITFANGEGTVVDVVHHIVNTEKIDLVVIGTHESDGLSTFLLGNHCRNLIDSNLKKLLLVPFSARLKSVKKIAYAIDLENAGQALNDVYELIPLAKELSAEILITHISHEKDTTPEFEMWMKNFLTDISNKADYPNIYYRIVHSDNPEKGLAWLCEHGEVDILAMHHRQHGFFDALFNGSHTKKMADKLSIPLLVFSN
jgi:nucleotide-binding universal stress UspA family protein